MTMRTKPQEKIRRLWKSKKRYKVAYGGRGSGKSYGVAERFVLFALQEPGVRLLCTKETQNTLSDSTLAIIKRVIADRGLSDAFVPTKHGLSCRNGSEFIFRGLQHPERIRSLEGIKYCWVEEATKVSRNAWDILSPTIRADDSEIWVTFNPDMEDDPTYQMFVAHPRDDAEVVKINYDDNRYITDALLHEMQWARMHDMDKYLHVWEGELRNISDAQVFANKWRVGTFETPDDVTLYFGADWGFSQDPTVLVRCYIDGNTLYIDHEAYGVGVEIVDTPAMFAQIDGSKRWTITADSARPEVISHMRNAGFNMRSAAKGPGSIEDGIAFLRSFDEIVIHERCKHTADELKLYSYKRDRLTGDILPVVEDKHNHCIDALRYGLERVMLSKRAAQVSITERIW